MKRQRATVRDPDGNVNHNPCWEVVSLRVPLLTIHRAPEFLALEFARQAARQLVDGRVRVLRLRRCACDSGHTQPGRVMTVIYAKPEEK